MEVRNIDTRLVIPKQVNPQRTQWGQVFKWRKMVDTAKHAN